MVIILMAVTSAAIYFFGDVKIATGDVNINLPSAIGAYEGKDVLFCSNEACGRSFAVNPGVEMRVCPVCHAPLDVMSPAERAILPAGTLVMKKTYSSPQQEPIFVSVVISGTDRLGIHRPQNCLPAQGFTISKTERMPIKIQGREDLIVTLLELERKDEVRDGAGSHVKTFSMAYWYFSGGHETPYQSSMMFWMAYDRIFLNRAERWAYISIMTPRRGDSSANMAGLDNFVSLLHPVLRKTAGSN